MKRTWNRSNYFDFISIYPGQQDDTGITLTSNTTVVVWIQILHRRLICAVHRERRILKTHEKQLTNESKRHTTQKNSTFAHSALTLAICNSTMVCFTCSNIFWKHTRISINNKMCTQNSNIYTILKFKIQHMYEYQLPGVVISFLTRWCRNFFGGWDRLQYDVRRLLFS